MQGLATLLLLDLSNNKLESLPAACMQGLTSLQTLKLSQNLLSAIPPTCLRDIGGTIQSLYLSNNLLTGLGIFFQKSSC